MPQFDLSTLPAPELRQLLDSARQRGQAAQSYEILREMETRRLHGEPAPRKRLSRRAARKSRTIELNLGDPLDADRVEAELLADDGEPPLRLGEAPPPIEDTPPPPARVRQRWGHWATLCFALGLGGGVAAGWWAADGGQWQRPALPPAPAAAPPAPRAPRAPLPVTVAEAAPVMIPTAPAAPPAEAVQAEAASTAPETPAAPEAKADPAPRPSEVAAASACKAEPTPADRAICDAPALRDLQAQLRQSYAAALEAHEDKALLRQRELAWRDARNTVSDPEALAGLYRQRIAQLKAATLDAERQKTGTAHETRRRQASATAGNPRG